MIKESDILAIIPNLEPLPDTAMRIINVINNPNGAVESVVDIIQYDQVLTGKVLRIVNSASFGLNRDITSLKDALMYLGTNRLIQIILLAVPDSPLLKAVKGYGLERGELWLHSAGAAIAAQYLGTLVKHPDPNLLFTAGLLHDIGKCLLQEYVGNEYDRLMKKVIDEGLDFAEAERDIFGIDHAEAGGYIAEEWNLPDRIKVAIQYHHKPNECPVIDQTVDLVYVGDLLSLLMGSGLGNDGLNYRADSEILDRNKLGQVSLEKACAALLNEIALLKDFMFSE